MLYAADNKPETQPASVQAITLSDFPGITTPDKTPQACVDCHKNYPEKKKDFSLTAVLARWKDKCEPEVMAKAQAAAPAGITLKGKHPDVTALVKIIPDDCLMCHSRDSKTVPPFARMLHLIHLTDKADNHFLSKAKGTCTSCHKLDEKSGTWRVGSSEVK